MNGRINMILYRTLQGLSVVFGFAADAVTIATGTVGTKKALRRLWVEKGDEMEPELTEWFWQYKFAAGELNVICGLPDQGKGVLAADLIARVTTGAALPGETDAREPSDALIFSGEETHTKTTLPRIMAAGGNRSRLHFVRGVQINTDADEPARTLAFVTDSKLIREYMNNNPGIRLVVVDPVDAYFGGDKNSSQEVRRVYGALKAIAVDFNACFVLVDHFNKDNKQAAIHRVAGDRGAAAAPRTVWVVSKDTENPAIRHFANMKGNDIPEEYKTGWEFRIVGRPVTIKGKEHSVAGIEWLGVSSLSAEEIVNQKSNPEGAQLQTAKAFYKDVLEAGSPRLQAELYPQLESLGVSERTAKRAMRELGLTRESGHIQKRDGRWWLVNPG